jgi:hypothetical protein
MSDGSRVRDSLKKGKIIKNKNIRNTCTRSAAQAATPKKKKRKERKRKYSGPRSGSIHILVLAQMRNIGYHCARIHCYLFPHTIVHGSHGGSQAKHARVLFAEERKRDGHPELEVPLASAHLRVGPVRLHDDPHVRVKHLRLRQLPLGEGGTLKARREHGQRVALGGETAFIRMRRALDLDRVNRRQPDGHFVVRQNQDAGPCVQGAGPKSALARDNSSE